MLSRREFLGATCLILGFPWDAIADDNAETPLKKALKAAKERRTHTLALVLPDDEKGRAALAKGLEKCIPLPPGEGRAVRGAESPNAIATVLLEVVWVCTPAKTIDLKDGENAVLLDADGKRIAGGKIELSSTQKLIETAKTLIEGEERLAKRAEAIDDQKAKDAIKKIVEDDDKSSENVNYIYKNFEKVVPLIVQALRTATKDDMKQRLGDIIASHYWASLQNEDQLPFGVKWKVSIHEPKPCPPCGMACATFEGRKFVEFLTK